MVLTWPALGYAAHSQIPMTDLLSDIELAKVDPSSLSFSLSKDAGIGSMVHDLEPTTGAILDSSSMVTGVKVSM